MNSVEAFHAVVDVLERLSVPYMVVGSLSSNAYGIPRSTQDADFIVQLGETSIGTIARQLGKDFELERQMSFETITGSSRHVLEYLPTQFKIELFLLREDEYHQTRFARRARVNSTGREIWAATVEDVIIMKLRWGSTQRRGKDLDDVRNVLSVQAKKGASLDWEYIHHWCDRDGTRPLLERLRKMTA